MGEILEMKRPVLRQAENKDGENRIATQGRMAAGRKFNKSRKRIEDAMETIERDVENGFFRDRGRVTVAEVLNRAEKSEAYLRRANQPGIAELRRRVQDFVDRANNLIGQGACSVPHSGTERAREAEAELEQVRQAYAEAEQEYADLKQRYAAALEKLETTERTIEELRAGYGARPERPSTAKVIGFKPTGGS
jgi:DNA repair exonuclease SbcCD ATPase subunit